MPNYDYKCPECHVVHEVTHAATESPEIKCGMCKEPMRKLYSLAAVTFKGGGWGKDAR